MKDKEHIQNKIIDYLKNDEKAKTLIEINDGLSLSTSDELKDLEDNIQSLIEKGILYETKKNKYMLIENTSFLATGELEINKKGYGFVLQKGEDIFINKDNLNGAIDKDFVLVELFERNKKVEGKVLRILKRNLNTLIGEILYVNDEPTIILDDKKLDYDIKIENHFANLVDGHKVVIELVRQLSSNSFIGLVTKIIGHKNDPDIDILVIANKHGIELEFSDKAMEEVKNIPDHVLEKDKIGRKDLTNKIIFTIDGDDTKDIDDAISIKKEGSIYELGVHIADVSYYVKPNTNIYKEAYNKGTSSYLADKVLPMLPHELSNGICSLNPNVERLTISCVMKINSSGEIINHEIFPSVIKSRKQMTYKNVNKIIVDNEIVEGYEEFTNHLHLMNELANILRKRKEKKGYIEFNIPEAKIIQDENGKCIDVIRRERKSGENLIEDFMVAANECVAKHISDMKLPFIYRVHGTPKQDKIDEFITMLKINNIDINTSDITSSSKSVQRILNDIKDLSIAPILSSMLLRCMQKAIYSKDNIGHFGLCLEYYTHFTSPIRRFPDTTVHQLLRTYLFNDKKDSGTIKYYDNYLDEVALHSSEMEQASIDAEREVQDMKMAEYMESHIGEEFSGIISTVTEFGFFVELPNLVEGLVHVNTLDGYYKYVPELLSLVSDNKTYRIGMEVNIRVINASKEERIIDFEVIDGNN